MKHVTQRILALSLAVFSGFSAFAQFNFSNATARMGASNYSGCSVTIADWNGDGLDDIIRLDQGRSAYVSVQKVGQGFETISLGSMGSSSAWAMCIGDFDRNGYVDIVGGWNGSCKIMMINNQGTAGTLVTLPQSNFFLQNMTALDVNNDGWLDLFTCDDNGESSIYLNDGAGNLSPAGIIDFDVTTTDDSGNYGSVWTDFDNDGDLDLYIAKCRQGVNSPSDGRRINVMFVNNGDGTFTEDAAAYGINVGWQSWTSSFGDLDNDGDQDLLLTNHDFESQILENDGSGHYTDITASTGFSISDITPIESVMSDLDNDGFLDLMISGSDHRIYHNNGDMTFTRVEGVFNNSNMLTFSAGDLNHDGRQDIFAGYGSIYTTPSSSTSDIVWLNETANANHFLAVSLTGTVSNSGAVGAKATIYGAWGVQVREVRAGESYGTVNSNILHFGLGQTTVIDSIKINWPSGIEQVIMNPTADQFISIIESECVAAEAVITADGDFVLCGGNALTLNAPAGYTYLWSTGETSQSISVTTEGEYNVRLDNGTNCESQSRTIQVSQTPDETPAVAVMGTLEFCAGGSVQLEGPDGISDYSWSNGETGQMIEVTESGTYTLSIQGSCAEFTSTPVEVTVVDPTVPSASDVIIPTEGTATLTATGSNLMWYDAPVGGNLIGEGNSIESPVVTDNATFYVVSTTSFGGGTETAGELAPAGMAYGQASTNSNVYFDVNEQCVLNSFSVTTDTPGNRKINLYDASATLLNSVTVNLIAGTQVVNLNFEIAPGTGYYLATDASVNQASFGMNSPRLLRDNSAQGFPYPYNADGALSITGTQFGNSYFFYYYNWQITRMSEVCVSAPVAVVVSVDNSTGIEELASSISLYPNPASDLVKIQGLTGSAQVAVLDAAGRLVISAPVNQSGSVSVSNLPSGVYLIQVSNEQGISTHKLIKQ